MDLERKMMEGSDKELNKREEKNQVQQRYREQILNRPKTHFLIKFQRNARMEGQEEEINSL